MVASKTFELAWGETVPVAFTITRNGVPVPAAGATVTFSAMWVGEPVGRNFGPSAPASWIPGSTIAIEDFACSMAADQDADPGEGTFTPTTVMYSGAPPGVYWLQFRVVFADTSVQFFPRRFDDSEYELLIHPVIRALNDT